MRKKTRTFSFEKKKQNKKRNQRQNNKCNKSKSRRPIERTLKRHFTAVIRNSHDAVCPKICLDDTQEIAETEGTIPSCVGLLCVEMIFTFAFDISSFFRVSVCDRLLYIVNTGHTKRVFVYAFIFMP